MFYFFFRKLLKIDFDYLFIIKFIKLRIKEKRNQFIIQIIINQ